MSFYLFGSFGMAYDFIDSVGNDVDVVSDSEVSVILGVFCDRCFIPCCVLHDINLQVLRN